MMSGNGRNSFSKDSFRELRLALLGAGSVGADHVRAARGVPGCRFVAVSDIRRDAAEELAAEAGARAYTDHRAMFAESTVDAVVITAPHALHRPLVLDAAAAGLHVLVEKPMATSVADCTEMIEACRTAGTVLAVAHVIHFDPLARAAREVITSGRCGDPLLITHRRTAHYDPGSRPDWFFDPRLAGGGIVLNVGAHGLDRVQWFGGAPVTKVSAVVRGRADLAVETDCLALVELANGVAATVNLSSRGAPFYDETEVVLTEATLRVSSSDGLLLSRGGGTTRLLAPGPDHYHQAFADQLTQFAQVVRGGTGELVPGEYARSVVAAAIAIYRSAEHGEPVTLPVEAVLR